MEKETVYQTECMKAVVGIPNEVEIPGLSILNTVLIKCVELTESKTGIYLAMETHRTSIHYKEDWGCPDELNGEDCICIEILRNPKFNTDPEVWKKACLELIRNIKRELNQSTISAQFFNIDMVYLFTENE